MKKIFSVIFFSVLFRFGFGQNIGTEVLSYHNGCTYPETFAGILIDTKIPFDQSIMHTIILEGYAYGTAENIDLKINFYLYNPGTGMLISNPVVSTSGAYQPKIKIINKNGFISIFLERGTRSQYCINFKARAWQTQGWQPTWYQNWTADKVATDPSIGLSSLFVGECVYKNNFSGNVGIGTMDPGFKLEVNGHTNISAGNNLYMGGKLTLTKGPTYQTINDTDGRNAIYLGGTVDKSNYYDNNNHFFRSIDVTKTNLAIVSDKIGIGTSTPLTKLHIEGNGIMINNPGNAFYNSGVKFKNDGFAHFSIGSKGQNFVISNTSSDGTLIWPPSVSDLLTITNNGNVGIGTTTPTFKLDVNGSAKFASFYTGTASNTINLGYDINNDTQDGWINYTGFNGGITRFRNFHIGNGKNASMMSFVGSTGNIGIGTLSPSTALEIGTPSALVYMNGSSNISGIALGRSDYSWRVSNETDLRIYGGSGRTNTASNIALSITNTSMNIGIGTLTPQNKLEIVGAPNSSGLRFKNLKSTTPVSPSNNKALSVDANGDVILVNTSITNPIDSTVRKNIYFQSEGGSILASQKLSILNNGYVGIGTNNPTQKLEIGGGRPISLNSNLGNLRMKGDVGGWAMNFGFTGSNGTEHGGLWGYGGADALNQWSIGKAYTDSYFVVKSDGKIGIGTPTPNESLEIGNNGRAFFGNGAGTSRKGLLISGSDPNVSYARIESYSYATSTGIPLIINPLGGQVAIGTTTPASGYKLSVAGNIIADKIKVKKSFNGTWPDFVFQKDYKLPSLSDIEKFVNENSHLPEIPSAAEVEKDGQDLGEMNRLLLKKVEELTLYLIEQEKKMSKIIDDNYSLNKRISTLETIKK